MTGEAKGAAAWGNRIPAKWLLLALWLISVSISLFLHRGQILQLAFWDPDDSMRLVEVRDFLAGQSWFDVSQHRANPPFGSPMHWSRLVDLPIAACILLLRPLVGAQLAEIGAILMVPALTLASLLAAFYWAVRPLLDKAGTLLCCVALVASPAVLLQFPVMRIDHHAWQIVFAAIAMGGSFHRNTIKGGISAGLSMAFWLQVSIEGLPFAVLIEAVMLFRYARNAREWPRLCCFVWTLVVSAIVLYLSTHRWPEAQLAQCDALSSAYLFPLCFVPLIVTAGHWIAGEHTVARRLAPAGVAGCVALAVLALHTPDCMMGPFSSLDPLITEFWYRAVREGLPLWRQSRAWIAFAVFTSVFAIVGNARAILETSDRVRKVDWECVLILALAATLLGFLVFRTMLGAQLFYLPGTIYLVRKLFERARLLKSVALRVPATIVSLFLFFPMVTAAAMAKTFKDEQDTIERRFSALVPYQSDFAALEAIAPTTLFAPIDVSPDILLLTRNSVVGTGHHRNVEGMKLVIGAFLAPPDHAREIVLRSSANYLVIGFVGETERYWLKSPHGLAAQLLDNKPPPWLTQVPVPGVKGLRIYRIDRSSAYGR